MPNKTEIEVAHNEEENRQIALQTLYGQVVMDTNDIKHFLTFFRQATKRVEQLQDAYYGDFDDEIDVESDPEEIMNDLLEEDPVFDITAEQLRLVQKLLLAIAKYLN